MHDTETPVSDTAASPAPGSDSSAGESQPAVVAPSPPKVANRPDTGWLDEVEGEIDDVDTVLKCLARDSATICKTCDALRADGALDARPVLARCAGTKSPR